MMVSQADMQGAEAGWIVIGHIDQIPVRGARCVKTPLGKFAVFRTADGAVFALENRCPHKQASLADGIVHGHAVTCPMHNWVISLETGAAQGADEGQVLTLPVRNEGGTLLLHMGAAAGAFQVAAE